MVTAIASGDVNIIATATDGSGVTGSKSITVLPSNRPPEANDDFFTVEESGNLMRSLFADNTNGADSDPDGDDIIIDQVNENAANLSNQVFGSTGGIFIVSENGNVNFDTNNAFDDLEDGESAQTSITYRLSDGSASGNTATVTVNVTGASAVNQPPIATAGENMTITLPSDNVTLNGRGTDNDGTIASFFWEQISSTSGSRATIVSSSMATTNINDLQAGSYEFQLTVTDNDGAIDVDNVTVIVETGNSVVFSDVNRYNDSTNNPDVDENFRVSGTVTITGAPATFEVTAFLLVAIGPNDNNLDNIITTDFSIDNTTYTAIVANAGSDSVSTPPIPPGTYRYFLNVQRNGVSGGDASWGGSAEAIQ